jgi:hypothetical protein
MKILKLFFGMLMVICFFNGTPPPPIGKTAEIVAQKVWNGLRSSTDDGFSAVLGFRDAAGGRKSKLGKPMRVYDLACDAVLKSNSASNLDLEAMSGGRELFYFPLQDSSGSNRSLLLVSRLKEEDGYGKKGYWTPIHIGARPLMRKLDAALHQFSQEKAASMFIVQIPIMGAFFLGFEANGEIRLTPGALLSRADSCLNQPPPGQDQSAGHFIAALARCFDPMICKEFKPSTAGIIPKQGEVVSELPSPENGSDGGINLASRDKVQTRGLKKTVAGSLWLQTATAERQ